MWHYMSKITKNKRNKTRHKWSRYCAQKRQVESEVKPASRQRPGFVDEQSRVESRRRVASDATYKILPASAAGMAFFGYLAHFCIRD